MYYMIINYITYIRTGIKVTDIMDRYEFVYWWTTRINTQYWFDVIVRLIICAVLVTVEIILIKNFVKKYLHQKDES